VSLLKLIEMFLVDYFIELPKQH